MVTRRTSTGGKRRPRKHSGKSPGAEKPLWEEIVELGYRLTDEDLKRHPTDGVKNLDHYLYGAPKEE